MSHKIAVDGSIGSAESLKATLRKAGVDFSERSEGGDSYLILPKYSAYGNEAKICTNNPSKSSVDYIHQNTFQGFYRDSMTSYVKDRLLIDGHSVTSETRVGQNIVLRVAVG